MNLFASNELSTVHEFLQIETQLISIFGDDSDLPSLRPILDGLGSTTMLFGLCELNDKRYVRRDAAKQSKILTAGHLRSRDLFQKQGLSSLNDLIGRARSLEKELLQQSGKVSLAHVKEKLQEAHQSFTLYLGDSEIKDADIKKLDAVFKEVESAFVKGEKEVGALLLHKLEELERLRKSPDRGNRENIPLWKLVLIAAYLIVSLTYVIRCIIQDRCSRNEKAFFYVTAAILGISLKFC
jgi:hypothetical protein